MKSKTLLFVFILICGLILSALADIKTTKHNLSATGPGPYKATTETGICVSCHAPHGASPAVPLWNHTATAQTFLPYNQSISATLKSNPGQPDGSSKLCLGCHDGTVALGSTGSGGVIAGLGGALTGSALIGTNLSGSHPLSFMYDNSLATQRGELVDPATLTGAVKLDNNSKLQCTTCHDPHDDSNGSFLVRSNSLGGICTTCHVKTGWSAGLHQSTPAISEAGCNSCHAAHGSASTPLLKNPEPTLCYDCHKAGGLASTDIQSQFLGSAAVTRNEIGGGGNYATINTHHDVSAADQAISGSRLNCSNCHNAHAVQAKSGSGPAINSLVDPFSRNTLWSGAGATSYRVSIINFCLSCHGGTFPPSVYNPAQTIAPTSLITDMKVYYQTDVHGDGTHRPNAGNPAPPVVRMACTDCHGSHGSTYTGLSWNGNVYNIADFINGTIYTDNGAGPYSSWPYKPPTQPTGQAKTVRVSPAQINTAGAANNLYNLCGTCHTVTSGSGGSSHMSIGFCSGCHYHGTSAGLL